MSDRAGLPAIAIVGVACRFPGAPGPAAFWEVLRAGRETIRHFSAAELAAAGVAAETLDDPRYVRARGAVDAIEDFDAAAFGLSAREASWLDPQHRLWLECAWEALEDAGYHRRGHGHAGAGAVGVFAGCRASSYLLTNLSGNRERAAALAAAQDPESYQIMLGNDKDFLATRTSHLLDLRGPSVTVQTACSSSLVAVAQACQSLLAHQSDICLAGGVSLAVPSVQGYRYQEGGIHAPDGRCRAFDAHAQGTVFADGAGVVALKRLDEALADGDDIYAVIRGWAVNNDGAAKPSFAAPGVSGQAEVVALAQAVAGVDPRTVTYVEAHGTGTALGDPVEIAALTRAFRLGTEATGFCAVGSVKTNIGHADAAAGIAGLIKTSLALRHAAIPASLHFVAPNPAIDFAASPFYVARELMPWPRDGAPRRAGVTSLGVGGTNCHVVLEEAPAQPPRTDGAARPRHVLALSARTAEALAALARRHADHLAAAPDADPGDVCFTLNTGRAALPHRLAVTAADTAERCRRLADVARGEAPGRPGGGDAPRPMLAFLFTGQGAQHADMGRALRATQPVFRDALERCDALLQPRLGRPLLDALDRDPALLEDAAYLQPALFAIQMALVELWRSWGVRPDIVAGHSAGELAAACAAGVFDLEDGLALIAERGRLMAALPPGGAMATVRADERRVARALAAIGAAVALAAVNEPQHVVISGARDAVEAALRALRADGVEARPLAVTHAFHSPLMDPMLEAFERVAARARFAVPRTRLVSTVTGAVAGAELAAPAYWRDQVRRPVRFAEAVRALGAAGATVFVEIGPHPVLCGMGRRGLRDAGHAWLPSLVRGRPDWEPLLESLAALHHRGWPVDWRGFDAPYPRRRLHLPTYPFQRRRHWIDPPPGADPLSASGDSLLGRRLSLPLSPEIRFESVLSPRSAPHLGDHRLFGTVVVAAATDLALFLSAVEAAFGPRACALESLAFMRPLVLPDDGARRVQVVLAPEPDGLRSLRLLSCAESEGPHRDDAWTLHATARVRLEDIHPGAGAEMAALRARCVRETSGATFHRDVWGPGADTGPAFRWIATIWTGEGEAVSRTAPPDLPEDLPPYPLPPGLIEACFQTLFSAGEFETRELAESGIAYVPVAIARFAFHGRPSGDGPPSGNGPWCHARVRERHAADAPTKGGDARLLHEDGRVIAEIEGFEVRRLAGSVVRGEPSRPASAGLGRLLDRGASRDAGASVADIVWQAVWAPRALPTGIPSAPGHWLIITDRRGLGIRLADALERKGHRVTVIAADVGGEALEPALGRALDAAPAGSLRGAVYLRGIDGPPSERDGLEIGVASAVELLHLAQALAARPVPPRLWVVTDRAQPVLPGDDLAGAAHAALWGLARVVAREVPALASWRHRPARGSRAPWRRRPWPASCPTPLRT